MFWKWYEEYAFMECERGQHESQVESLTQVLFGATFWGDYNGSSFSRFNHEYALENWSELVESVTAGHGQGLMLKGSVIEGGTGVRYTRDLIEFVLYFTDPDAYPLYDEGAYSYWESAAQEQEIDKGWWGEYNMREVRNALDNFGEGWGEILVADQEEFAAWFWEFYSWNQDNWDNPGAVDFEMYWEGADSLIVGGYEPEKHAEWILGEYAKTLDIVQDVALY